MHVSELKKAAKKIVFDNFLKVALWVISFMELIKICLSDVISYNICEKMLL